MRKKVEERLAQYRRQKEGQMALLQAIEQRKQQTLANINAHNGAIEACEQLLAEERVDEGNGVVVLTPEEQEALTQGA